MSSTEFKSEECVDSLKDATFVFDDLFKEKNAKIRKDYKKRVRNIIRNFADNSPRMTARSSFENNCQVIITAEYLLNTKTDIGRLMLLQLEKPINSERLSLCQKQPLAVSSFYYHFIKWISSRYSDIVDDLKTEFKAFRISSKSHLFGYERLYEYTFLLEYAFNLLLDYAIEVGCQITDKKSLQDHFSKYINNAMTKQKEIIESLETKEVENINFSQELLAMINDGIIKCGDKGTPCFRKGNDVYITNEMFGKCLRQKFSRDFSAKEITAYFRNRYISKSYADNRLKKYNGKCYLILNVSELVKDANDNSIAISNLFFE